MKAEKCHKCGAEMKLVTERFEGVVCESYRCPKCRTAIFTEEQAHAFGRIYQQKIIKEKYTKRPVKIGHSYGVIFPKGIVKVFNLDSEKVELSIKADQAKNKIEITVL
jgi:hypothetical protein